jgi:hypothetical protein
MFNFRAIQDEAFGIPAEPICQNGENAPKSHQLVADCQLRAERLSPFSKNTYFSMKSHPANSGNLGISFKE